MNVHCARLARSLSVTKIKLVLDTNYIKGGGLYTLLKIVFVWSAACGCFSLFHVICFLSVTILLYMKPYRTLQGFP